MPASASRTVPAHAEAIAVPWPRVEAIRVRAAQRLVAGDVVEDLRGAAGGPCGDHQQVCPSAQRGRLGCHEMPSASADLGLQAYQSRMPGRGLGDLVGHRVRLVEHVEDRGESGVEHAVLDQDCDLDVGNAIKRGVSTTYPFTGPRLASWCIRQTPVRLGFETH